MFRYLEAPNDLGVDYDKFRRRLSLVGGMSTKENWQLEVMESLKGLDILLVNPRRQDHYGFKLAAGYDESRRQIQWESFWRTVATQVMFWFSDDTLQPISLLELGQELTITRHFHLPNKAIFIGIHPEYERRFDLMTYIPIINGNFSVDNISDSLDGLVKQVITYNNNLDHYENKR
jgi:hypothetical protein